jgi:IPT/TIG domain-containing protein/FG-GAP repeat protein/VCBS repeat protein
MLAISRMGVAWLVGALALAPSLHAWPSGEPAGGEEDSCVHLIGYGGASATLPRARPRALQPSASQGGSGGGTLAAGVCAVDDARLNRSSPFKTTADFVPITGDDSLGFYCVYGVKASPTGGVGGNVGIFLFDLGPGEVLVFGSGYGNIAGANLFDAAYDMERVDQVLRFCMGKVPAQTLLRLVAPHGHADHLNPACNRELERLGYRIGEITFHTGDFAAINAMGWTTADRALFRVLPNATTCLQELATFASPLGKLWFYERPGHTPGSIDLVIDVKNDPTNRFVVRGSQPGTPCAPISGQREIVNAHGNVELLAPTPTLADVLPDSGTSLGGSLLTLTGTGFGAAGAGTPKVLVAGAPATEVTVLSDTSLTCKTPAGPAGQLVEVMLVTNNGKSLWSGTYFYNALPTVTSLSPVNGDWRGGTIIQVRGSGFLLTAGTNEVFFGTKKGTSLSIKSDTLLTCRTPSGTPGTVVSVKLRNPNGEATLDNAFTYSADVAITALTPASGSALGGRSVQLTGLGFTGNGATPSVTFGGIPATGVVLVSDTSVMAVVPPGTPGTNVDVVLTNSFGSATFSTFRYHATPSILSVTPGTGRANGGTLVTLGGSGFLADAPGVNQVRFGGIPATQVTVLSNTSLTCLSPLGTGGELVNVTLSNENGTATLPSAFVYGQALSISQLLPASGSSQGGTQVTIQGSGFLSGPAGPSTVLFGAQPATGVSVVDDATLLCTAPAGTPLTQVAIQITNANGTVTIPAAYRYHARPTLTSLSPNHGHGGGFTPVTLTGTGFQNDDAGFGLVVVGGVAASDVDVLSDTLLSCVVQPGTPGAVVDVIVVNQNGSASLPGGFRYHTAPTVTSASPASGASNSQLRVTLTGVGFLNDGAGTPSVSFGGLPATSISVVNDTSLRCNAPTGTPGTTVDVVVSNARGAGTLSGGYRFHARPVVAGANPARGTFQGGTRVTLSGSGFQRDGAGTNVITFGGALATSVVVSSDTSLQCTAPPGTLGAVVDILLSNANGTGTLTRGFSYSVAPPTVVSLSPPSGPAHAPGSTQLTGTGFLVDSAGPNTVRFGAQTSSIVGVLDDTHLIAQVPPGTPGASVDVALSNLNGSALLAQGFRYHALPVLTSLEPAAGSAVGGTIVLVRGSGFSRDAAGTNALTFGGLPAMAVTVVDDTTLRCQTPPGVAGTAVEVRLANANGQSGPSSFGYHALPSLATVTPESGPLVGGTVVTLTGSGFSANAAGPCTVSFGGRSASSVQVTSDSLLTCTTPSGDSGYVDVRVSNANGSSVLANGYYFGRLPPAVLAVEPAGGPSSGANLVTVRGKGFQTLGAGANRVKFGDVLSGNVITVDDTTILCSAPAGTPGAVVDLAVNNTKGTGTLPAAYRYHAQPTLLAVDPPEGEPLGVTRVTLTGTGFQRNDAGPATVLFDNVPARDVRVLDDQHLTCRVYGGGPGSVLDVTVRNRNGSAFLPDAYRVVGGPPSISSVEPNHGPFLGGTSVRIEGKGFSAGSVRLSFGGVAAQNLVVLGDGALTCVTPPGPLGQSVTLELSTKSGVGRALDGFTYEAVMPKLTAATPRTGPAAGGTRVTLTGSGFQAQGAGATVVRFGGIEATGLAIASDTSLACTTPAGDPAGVVDVELENQNGRAMLVRGFRYNAIPMLTALTPDVGPSAGGTSVTLTGSGFLADGAAPNTVQFGGQPALGVVAQSDTSLTCTTPPGTPGSTVDVRLSNRNGQAVLTAAFRYRERPVLTAVVPELGPRAGGTALVLTGSGFLADGAGPNSVSIGGLPALGVVTVDDATLSCTTPPGAVDGPVAVSVTNANGASTLPAGFRYFVAPTLAALAPQRGPAAGGTVVTLTGAGFLASGFGTNLVLFDGVAALDVIETSDTTLTCTTPPGTAGTLASVMLVNDNGVASLATAFRYHGAPRLTTLTPSHGPAAGGAATLGGSGFLNDEAGTNTVKFGALPASQVVVVSDATLTCALPAGTPGATVDVSVSNANGQSSLAAAYRYHALPTLTSAAPSRGPAAGGNTVTLTGSGFLVDGAGTPSVRFGTVLASSVQVLSDTSLSCAAPAGTPGAVVTLTLANANGQVALPSGYRYNALPVLTAVAPVRGNDLGGTTVTLTGSGFSANAAGACTVLFDGVSASDVIVASDTSLSCKTPPGTAGATVAVRVSNANGFADLAAAYRYTAAPRLTSVTADHGTSFGGTTVVLTGSGFTDPFAGATLVYFDGLGANDVIVLSGTQVQCSTPAGNPGAPVDVRIANQNGEATLPAGFRYNVMPAVSSVTPPQGSSGASSTVMVSGYGFEADEPGPNTVLFGSEPATDVVVLNDGALTCTVAPQPVGTMVGITVSNANGSGTLDSAFLFFAPQPRLLSLAPTSGVAAGGTRVTLTGSGFLDYSAGTNSVGFGAFSASDIVVLSDTQLECTTPAGPLGESVLVSVANVNGLASLPSAFTYVAPAPTLTSLSSSSGPAAGGTTLTLVGTGFLANGAGANAVTFGGTPATNVSVLGDTSLTCTVPTGASGSTVDVALANANGTAKLTGAWRYRALPVLTSVSPVSGTSLGGTLVTVRGTGFLVDAAGPNAVLFGGTPATSVVVFDDTRLTCRAPSGSPGSIVTITLSNANGAAQLTSAYRYHSRPTLTAVTAASGPAAGGNRVTLTGTGFLADGASVNIVSFGGITATGVTVLGNTSLQCNVPAGTSGLAVQVAVANVNGTALLSNGYRYHAKPALASLSPAEGPLEGGTSVTLTGSGFLDDAPGTNSVTFGGVAASAVSVLSNTELSCATPPGPAGAVVDVAVANANGSATLFGAYTYASEALLVVSSSTPNKGSTLGSTLVTLGGMGFVPGLDVRFGGVSASNVNVLDANTLTCLTPPGTGAGWVDVSVHGPGSASLALGYRFVDPPVLLALEPPFGDPAGGTMVVLTGSGFQQDGGENLVTFGGVPAVNVSVLDDAHLACEAPAGPALSDGAVVVANEIGSALLDPGYRWKRQLATDIDNDGRGDLILSSPGDDAYSRDAGAVRVFLGESLPFPDQSSAQADLTATPEQVATEFGMPVASGDLDGDGRAELLIGAPGDDKRTRDAGTVFVYRGPLPASAQGLSSGEADLELFSTRSGDRFGSALLVLDFDRNGILDVVVGAPGRTGAAHLFLGGSGGLATTPALVLAGVLGNEAYATSLAAGDLDGDGWLDLVVGAPNTLLAGTTLRTGDVRVFHGGPNALQDPSPAPWLVFNGLQDAETFGRSIACGDIDGDGLDDLVVGAPANATGGALAGAVFVFRGGSTISSRSSAGADVTLVPEAADDRFGRALALGDANGDGRDELLIGAPGHGGAGRAYLFLGTQGFTRTQAAEADFVFDGEVGSQGEFGSSVALIDVDGDGLEDAVVTAPGLDSFGSDLGRVYVFGAPLTQSRSGADDDGSLTGATAGDQLGRALSKDL